MGTELGTQDTEVTDGETAETSTATEQATETEKPETNEGGEDDKPELEKKYTDADMAEARRKYQGETKKEREARIRSEERVKVYEEIHGGKKQPETPPAEEFEPTRPRPKRPNDAEFDSRDDYLQAEDKYLEELADWTAEQREVKRETESRKKAAAAPIDEFKAKGIKKFGEDFEEVPHLQIYTPVMTEFLMSEENGVDIAYYLSQHRDEAERIGKLSLIGQARELDKLSEKVKTLPAKQKNIPPPAPRLDGRGSASTEERIYTDPNTSTEERIRISQERKRREAQGK